MHLTEMHARAFFVFKRSCFYYNQKQLKISAFYKELSDLSKLI